METYKSIESMCEIIASQVGDEIDSDYRAFGKMSRTIAMNWNIETSRVSESQYLNIYFGWVSQWLPDEVRFDQHPTITIRVSCHAATGSGGPCDAYIDLDPLYTVDVDQSIIVDSAAVDAAVFKAIDDAKILHTFSCVRRGRNQERAGFRAGLAGRPKRENEAWNSRFNSGHGMGILISGRAYK